MFPPLLGVLRDANQNEGFRARVAETLAEIGTPTCVEGLMQAARDDSVLVRWSAVTALGNMRCRDAIPVLNECLRDPGTYRVSDPTKVILRAAKEGQAKAGPVTLALSVKNAAQRALSLIQRQDQPTTGADERKPFDPSALQTKARVTHDEALNQASEQAVPDGTIVSIIEAHRALNATPFYLRQGKTYRILVKGTWGHGRRIGSASGYPSTPLLRPWERFRRLPVANWLALTGRIGERGKIQFMIPEIGSIYTARDSGLLYCFANGLPFTNFRNRGSLELRVMQLEVPDPATIAQRHGFEWS